MLGEVDDGVADGFDDDAADEFVVGGDRAGGRLEGLLARLPVRIDPGRRAAVAMGAVVLVVALATGLWLLSSRPRAATLAASPAGAQASGTTSSAGALPDTVPLSPTDAPAAGMTTLSASPAAVAASSEVVVDVAGKVRHPGLYRLPAGSRIDDALTAAGGARRGVDLSTLNLAAPLVDGQQILVGMPGAATVAAPVTPDVGSDTGAVATAPVSLNTATLEQLETLPRVGPVTAQKILDYRSAHGSFTSIDQLKDISGIGDVTFAGLAPLVTL